MNSSTRASAADETQCTLGRGPHGFDRQRTRLHARSAAGIVKLAGRAKARVRVSRGDESVDAASILDLLTLGCARGTRITVHIEDPADTGILNDIAALVENGFGERQNG